MSGTSSDNIDNSNEENVKVPLSSGPTSDNNINNSKDVNVKVPYPNKRSVRDAKFVDELIKKCSVNEIVEDSIEEDTKKCFDYTVVLKRNVKKAKQKGDSKKQKNNYFYYNAELGFKDNKSG